MFVVIRFRVPPAAQRQLRERLEPALEILRTRPGFRGDEFGVNTDEPDLVALVLHWDDIGSYRRGIGGLDGKMYVQPVLADAIDEPTAYVSDPGGGGARFGESNNDHRGGAQPPMPWDAH